MKKLVVLLLMIFALTCPASGARSPVNVQATRKQQVPAWLRREHHYEEASWNRSMEEMEREFHTEDPDPEEVELLAIAIYSEAGADVISDDTRRMVGDVILNRVADPRYPNTIAGVLTQRSQYGRFYWTGIIWPPRAQSAGEAHAVDRAREIARQLLAGTHSSLYGEGYIYQAEFQQGRDQVQSDGIWFGR